MDRRKQAMSVALSWVAPVLLGMLLVASVRPFRRPDRRGAQDRVRRSDREAIRGIWECVSLERDGRTVYEGEQARVARITFAGDRVVMEDDGASLIGTSRLDPDAHPKAFVLIVDEGGADVTYPSGIYSLESEEFRLCFAFPAKDRPTEFTTFPGSGRTLFVYGRNQGVLRDDRESIRSGPVATLALEPPAGGR